MAIGLTIFCLDARAGAPVLLQQFDAAYSELVSDGTRVWACRYASNGPTRGASRLVANGDKVSIGAEKPLPARVLRMTAAPDGTLYAIAQGTEPDVNPSIHLWRRPLDAGWGEVAVLRGVDYTTAVTSADFGFINGKLVVDFRVTWSFHFSGLILVNGPPDEPLLVIYDTLSGAVTKGPFGARGLRGNGPLFCFTSTSSYIFAPLNHLQRSDDGLSWERVPLPYPSLNKPAGPFLFGDDLPTCTLGECLFFREPGSTDVGVMTGAGIKLLYPIPFGENGYGLPTSDTPAELRFNSLGCEDLIVGNGGESFLGFYSRSSQTGGPNDYLVVSSDDYLQTFHFFDFQQESHVSAAVGANAFYFLRATDTGTALYRVKFPSSRVTVVGQATLAIGSRVQTFSLGYTTTDSNGNVIPKTEDHEVIDLTIRHSGETFYKIEISTDLKTWIPLGLPAPTTKPMTLLVQPGVPARFFR